MDKKFCEYFAKYTPKKEHGAFIDSITEWNVRINKETRRVEITASLSRHVDQMLMIDIENSITEAYALLSTRIFPKYDESLFGISAIKEIINEALRTGLINNGFFDGATYEYDDERVVIKIPFLSSGVDYLSHTKCKQVVGAIIENRYGLVRTVDIESSDDSAERTRERQGYIDSILEQYDRNLKAAYATYDERIKNAPQQDSSGNSGGGFGGPWQRKPKREVPIVNHDASVYNALRTKIAGNDGQAVPNEVKSQGLEYLAVNDGKITSGLMTFNISEPEYLLGTSIDLDKMLPIEALNCECKDVSFCGEVFECTKEESRKGDRFNITIGVTDNASSIYIKCSKPKTESGWLDNIKPGKSIAVKGSVARSDFDGEFNVNPKSIAAVKRVLRSDNAEKKRVELHVHTNMSAMDAIIVPDDLVKTAKRWGHPKIAVTDHGNVQAFPEIMKSARKQEYDVIYGMEAYFVDDTEGAVSGDKNEPFDGEFVVFDIETTGLSPLNCKITEIGAVLLRNGEIVEKYNTFVNPGVHIPENITALTSITDEMVADAPDISVVLPEFLEFVGDRILIAHNANFDIGFIRVAAEELKIPFTNT